MLLADDVPHLRCPQTGEPLRFEGELSRYSYDRGDRLQSGSLVSATTGRSRFRVERGIAHLLDDAQLDASDKRMRFVYDGIADIHDAAVRYGLPLYGAGTEHEIRSGYLPYMALGDLRRRDDDQPLRILEVGMGTGANLPLAYSALPVGLPVQIWGCDLSSRMLDAAHKRIANKSYRSLDGSPIRTMLADAHALPFPDHMFDRVYHMGGIAGFGDQAKALAEMARVAKPGTPIVVVDEAFDESRRSNLYNRVMFKMLTLGARPGIPIEYLPRNARVITAKQLTLFYYVLAFAVDDDRSSSSSA